MITTNFVSGVFLPYLHAFTAWHSGRDTLSRFILTWREDVYVPELHSVSTWTNCYQVLKWERGSGCEIWKCVHHVSFVHRWMCSKGTRDETGRMWCLISLCMVYKKKVRCYMNFKRLAFDVTLKINFVKSCFSAKSVIQFHRRMLLEVKLVSAWGRLL